MIEVEGGTQELQRNAHLHSRPESDIPTAPSPENLETASLCDAGVAPASEFRTEGRWLGNVWAGFSTALASSYALFMVPSLLHLLLGVPYAGALTGTVLLAASMTFLMGSFARLPFAVVPSIGTCAVLATVVSAQNVSWQVALGISFWTGIAFLAVSLTTLREQMAASIPPRVREASVMGVGLLLIGSGIRMAGFFSEQGALLPVGPAVASGGYLTLLGLLVMLVMQFVQPRIALPAGLAAGMICALIGGHMNLPERLYQVPELTSVAGEIRLLDSLRWSLLPLMFTMFCTDLVDSLATFVIVSESMGLVDHDKPKNLARGLFVDSLATFVAPLLGTTPGSTCLQSVVASESFKPSGWTAVCTAVFYLPCLFLAPLALAVPQTVIAPVLILVGLKMLGCTAELTTSWRTSDYHALVTGLATIGSIAVRGSIAEGTLIGCAVWIVGALLTNQRSRVALGTYVLTAAGIVYVMLQCCTASS